ncbi:hypothetical protein AO498_02325 [Algoriphagus sanaruensis]|uniref:Uncharacterized protein n=1 Tax=Algoriphagus sanaruensis TaxID=1727163 RepID=A0A142EJB1_9BACT|nr:hypothetical protein AO498_02325 [Algoriphagus sanaruensis]
MNFSGKFTHRVVRLRTFIGKMEVKIDPRNANLAKALVSVDNHSCKFGHNSLELIRIVLP